MKIFKTLSHKIIIMVIIFTVCVNNFVFANNVNPSRKELESMIEEVAVKRAIPPVLLKSIARVESSYEPFNRDGSPKITGNSIGLMMINNSNGGYNSQRLKYDIEYNIEAGAEVLLSKWSMSSYNKVSSVGDMNPDVLENWYFTLWAYNGWAQSNNPNMVPYQYTSYVKKHTYQQLVYDICKKEYEQNISNIDFTYLPKTGKPSRSLIVPTPANKNSGGIFQYEIGDYVRTDGIRETYHLWDKPAGKYIYKIKNNQLATIEEGPVLQNGYYWYKVYINEYTSGWIERNWLLRTGDIENGRYVFDDISFNWARKDIMKLYRQGIINEATKFNPDENIKKEEFCIFLSKTMNLYKKDNENIEEYENEDNDTKEDILLPYLDQDKISSWAFSYVVDAYKLGYLDMNNSEFNPLESITRKKAALMLSNVFKDNNKYDNLQINQIFSDINTLNENEQLAIKRAYTNGFMSGKYSSIFEPDDYLTRAEAATIMMKILNKIENNN